MGKQLCWKPRVERATFQAFGVELNTVLALSVAWTPVLEKKRFSGQICVVFGWDRVAVTTQFSFLSLHTTQTDLHRSSQCNLQVVLRIDS